MKAATRVYHNGKWCSKGLHFDPPRYVTSTMCSLCVAEKQAIISSNVVLKTRKVYESEGWCPRGHQNPLRYASDNRCVSCKKEYDATKIVPAKPRKPKILTLRQTAEIEGKKVFDLGVKCWKEGHGTFRLVIGGACVDCVKVNGLLRSCDDPSRRNERARYADDPAYRAKIRMRGLEWGASEKGKNYTKKYKAQYNKENPEKSAKHRLKRRTRHTFATPTWLTEKQHVEIGEFYRRASFLTKVTCIPHDVDHIVPLQGKTVCGLNVPWNLQVLTAEENRRKRDRLPGSEELICRKARAYRQHASGFRKRTKPIIT